MLDHLGLTSADLARSKAFFLQALAPLQIGVVMEVTAEQTGAHDHIGFGNDGKPFFWLGNGGTASHGVHVAFACASRAQVDAFHAAALAAGGRDNGAPGLRPWYHPDYYGAFVLDPDGNNIEAVCHRPADGATA
ncbi:VOC family protein [Stenotrophomonas geniculata]|uniref:Glyoxalase n=2 Tax=Stenotrophomonas geniculata TaxID=86188 RepID=A0A0L8A823_9GAMM|nr:MULTISPECIES: VOC family protein [Stenotrophomonas]MBH1854214.1 VOC family protein [Stenotrophomonas maltophilia]KOE98376.1 glyoxalase [Stenotrophomonas geniculata N1]KRG45303.1 glyoxalase [Stenotrophomonas geniculata ATCC 19374 = JCM 13324]MCF3499036.1 VOC family protein [Stenotrophomonas maltophilia]MCI1053522.1 VOC family protein [Stenotrophomonas maltophilia]